MKIDKGIPIPKGRNSSKYDWNEMEVGDSTFFDNEPKGAKALACSAAAQYGYKHGMKFRNRKEGNGVRIWRIE